MVSRPPSSLLKRWKRAREPEMRPPQPQRFLEAISIASVVSPTLKRDEGGRGGGVKPQAKDATIDEQF